MEDLGIGLQFLAGTRRFIALHCV